MLQKVTILSHFSSLILQIDGNGHCYLKAVVGGTACLAMAGPLFWPKMVLAGPLFRPIIYLFFLPGNFSADQILSNNIEYYM